ncbi:plasminogen activator, urokinase b isoform X1 [Hippocampus zosterae]|uniref:plasminogen activator, urokinase b isoform X1 n=1 Tax=Hippocampus zosterae TaxID=109293 RepID=UPI00223C8F35|nr:plasminogen activator, urokinase b isoform X1 [Hippocampus zosterae]
MSPPTRSVDIEDAMRRAVALVLLTLTFCSSSAGGAIFSGQAGGREQPRRRPRRQTNFSSLSSSGICQNGGRSVPSLTTGRHMFCLCPNGFEGTFCQTGVKATTAPQVHSLVHQVSGADCYEGVGIYYRGFRSQSESGRRCEPWDADIRLRYLSLDVYGGRHNYCRNVRFKRRPWCHVWKEQHLVWEYCDIPRCASSQSLVLAMTTAAPQTTPPLPPTTQPPRTTPPAVTNTCGRRSRRKQMRIVGGSVAPVESHPWVAAILWRGRSKDVVFRCGGSLISSCWVMTAAHCFPDGSRVNERRFLVSLGKSALNQSDALEQKFRVDKIILHPDFNNELGNYDNDIALLKLKSKKDGRCARDSVGVRRVCLPGEGHQVPVGFPCEIAGYGKEKHGLWYHSQFLRQARVNLLAADVCGADDYYGDKITSNMLCAGRDDWTQDACEGDSGGPLVCQVDGRFVAVGVVSWGEGCARERRPGVYTKVHNYRQWIRQHTGV